MSQPFFEQLKAYYAGVGAVLRGEATASSVFPNSTDKGMSREAFYAEMLKQHIPSSCNMLLGGFLFGQDGTQSKQIDIIITEGSSWQYNFFQKGGVGKSFACVDGCLAVALVKSTLTSEELIDALLNLASIPDIMPLTQGRLPSPVIVPGFEDWPYKIIFALGGIEMGTAIETLERFYGNRPEIPFNKRPNLVHVLDKCAIARAGEEGLKTNEGAVIGPHKFHGMFDNKQGVGLIWTIGHIQEVASLSKIIHYEYGQLINRFFEYART